MITVRTVLAVTRESPCPHVTVENEFGDLSLVFLTVQNESGDSPLFFLTVQNESGESPLFFLTV